MRTAQRPVVDRYGDLEVTDAYRWLEELDEPEVQAWALDQDRESRAWLEASPRHGEALEVLTRTCGQAFRSDPKVVGGRLYFLERAGSEQALLRADGLGGPVIFDPQAWDPSGATALDWYFPAPDGRVALGLSTRGSEASVLHILLPNGRMSGDRIVDLPQASVAWRGRGLLFTRQQRPGGPPVRTGVFAYGPGGEGERCLFEGRPAERRQTARPAD